MININKLNDYALVPISPDDCLLSHIDGYLKLLWLIADTSIDEVNTIPKGLSGEDFTIQHRGILKRNLDKAMKKPYWDSLFHYDFKNHSIPTIPDIILDATIKHNRHIRHVLSNRSTVSIPIHQIFKSNSGYQVGIVGCGNFYTSGNIYRILHLMTPRLTNIDIGYLHHSFILPEQREILGCNPQTYGLYMFVNKNRLNKSLLSEIMGSPIPEVLIDDFNNGKYALKNVVSKLTNQTE